MKLTIALVLILCASFSSGCAPNVKNSFQIYKTIYKNVPCIQCQPFEVATALNFNCSNYMESFEGGRCGIFSPVYSLSAKHCAVAKLTCFPIGLGNVAVWGISPGSVADATNEEITLISKEKKLRIHLSLHCNNETTWQLGKLVGAATFLATTTPSLADELDGESPQFVIPNFFASGNFTLHCISIRPFKEIESGTSASTVTLSIPETDGETTVAPMEMNLNSTTTTATSPAITTTTPATSPVISTTTTATSPVISTTTTATSPAITTTTPATSPAISTTITATTTPHVIAVVDGNNVVDITTDAAEESSTIESAVSNGTTTIQTGNAV